VSVDTLLERLHNVKAIKPMHWIAGCPICRSKNGRPIAVTEKDGGIILMKPFCGCETGDVLRALGLKMSDLFPAREGHFLPPVRRAFDPLQILEALAHEFMVAELIACDVDRSGQYDGEQRERMRLVSQRVTAGVISLGTHRAWDAIRKVGRSP